MGIEYYLVSSNNLKEIIMSKSVKLILLIVGLVLVGYGIYTLVAPEASVSVGDISVEAQDNTDAYVTIGLGIVAVALGFLGGRK